MSVGPRILYLSTAPIAAAAPLLAPETCCPPRILWKTA